MHNPHIEITQKDLTSRWHLIQVETNWSGGRWIAESFLHRGPSCGLPWSATSSTSPVAGTTPWTACPQFCPGTQSPSLGDPLATLPWQESSMQLLPYQLPILSCSVKIELDLINQTRLTPLVLTIIMAHTLHYFCYFILLSQTHLTLFRFYFLFISFLLIPQL